MADGDRTAIDVELVLIERKCARTSHHLRAERLVDLETIDVGQLQVGLFEHGLDRLRGDVAVLEREADPEALEEVREALERIGRRRLVDPIREGNSAACELTRDRLVGREHELLDELMAFIV